DLFQPPILLFRHRKVHPKDSLRAQRVALYRGPVTAIIQAMSRTSLDQLPAHRVVEEAVDRNSVFQQSQGYATDRQPNGVIIRPVDRIDNPGVFALQKLNLVFGVRLLRAIIISRKAFAEDRYD